MGGKSLVKVKAFRIIPLGTIHLCALSYCCTLQLNKKNKNDLLGVLE